MKSHSTFLVALSIIIGCGLVRSSLAEEKFGPFIANRDFEAGDRIYSEYLVQESPAICGFNQTPLYAKVRIARGSIVDEKRVTNVRPNSELATGLRTRRIMTVRVPKVSIPATLKAQLGENCGVVTQSEPHDLFSPSVGDPQILSKSAVVTDISRGENDSECILRVVVDSAEAASIAEDQLVRVESKAVDSPQNK